MTDPIAAHLAAVRRDRYSQSTLGLSYEQSGMAL